MNTSIKSYNYLPDEAKQIRISVFVNEQGFIDEFDESDKTAIHFLMFDNSLAIGTARVVYSKQHHCYTIGRFAILKQYRRKGLGLKLIEFVEETILNQLGPIVIGISSQEQAINFYKKAGYELTNERYLDQDCPHVFMIKNLK